MIVESEAVDDLLFGRTDRLPETQQKLPLASHIHAHPRVRQGFCRRDDNISRLLCVYKKEERGELFETVAPGSRSEGNQLHLIELLRAVSPA